jgi:hypothetical protein
MNSVTSKKKMIKRELAELKLALSKKKKKLETRQAERRAALLAHRKKMRQKLVELEAVYDAKSKKLESKISALEEQILLEKNELLKAIAIEQHDAIEHLETYLEEIDHRYANLSGFWKVIKQEFRDVIRKNKKARKSSDEKID